MRAVARARLALLAAGLGCGVLCADEREIIASITGFLRTDEVAQRQAEVARIVADPAYDRSRVSDWLHQADVFPELPAGRRELRVPLRTGDTRTVMLQIPPAYDRRRPWPLICALHGQGGDAGGITGLVASYLGPNAHQYVIAAPQSYADQIIHQPEWPPTAEHPRVWREIKRTVHVDSDRVYLVGYSLGGHTTWTLAALHADQFAGAMPLASTFTLLLPDLLWESFLPNLAHLPLLAVWGEHDTQYGGERISPEGGIAGVNRRLRELVTAAKLPCTMIELPDRGHRDVVPPGDEWAALLARRRERLPSYVRHVFRDTYQGRAYWLEAHAWTGSQWTDKPPRVQFRTGEDQFRDADFDQATARTLRGLLGEVEGEVNGQEIRVRRKNIKDLTVWFGDGLVAWNRPVTIWAGGEAVFEGVVEPDLHVCLSQAARTGDFERLCWAGVRIRSGGKARLVTPRSEFPDLLAGSQAVEEPKTKTRR